MKTKQQTKEQISKEIDTWIDEEELPSSPFLKRLKPFDPYEGMDEDEIEAYREFRNWYLTKDLALLMSIPKPADESDFWKREFDEEGNDISAFNTVDYKKMYPFNKYHYRLKKIYEKVKDLAETYSCISDEQGRKNIYEKYINFAGREFRDDIEKGKMLIGYYKKYRVWIDKERFMERIEEINSKIRKCKMIWCKYSREETYIEGAR